MNFTILRYFNPKLFFTFLALNMIIPVVYYSEVDGFVVNRSTSLEAKAFLLLRPREIYQKISPYVAMKLPPVLEKKFTGSLFLKRVAAVEGDDVTVDGDNVCVPLLCVVADQMVSDRPLRKTSPTTIPDGELFVVGETTTSLDSRYALVGLQPKTNILHVAIPLPVPKHIVGLFP